MTPQRIATARLMYESREPRYTIAEIAETIGVGRNTIYRHLHREGGATAPAAS